MSKAKNYDKEFLKILKRIKDAHPDIRWGQMFSLAFSDYGDTFHISEKEMCYALEKYEKEIDLNVSDIAPDKYVDNIIEDATHHLFDGINDEEEDDEF